MEYSGIGKVKEGFVFRKSYEDFHRDGEVIEQLYEMTDGLLADKYCIPYGEYTLQIFNHAYCICWAFMNKKGSIQQIADSIEFRNEIIREYSWMVTYVLFRLHDKFYLLNDRAKIDFSNIISWDCYEEDYAEFVKENSLAKPIDFLGSLPKSEPSEEIDFMEARDYVMAAFDKAIDLELENKRLYRMLEKETKMRKSAERIVMEQQEKLNVWENDSFYKAVNIKTILEYAQNPENCGENDVKIIKLMLLDLCASKVPADVIKKIKTLKCGKIISIGNVTQMNTAATEITNHYHH